MSLYYFTSKIIKKHTQSVVASAAYRSGDSLYSERDQEIKDYRTREVLPESFILAPRHAPDWVYDRESLWNNVEGVENRWNAQLSREIVLALPLELTNEQQKEMLKDFVQNNFVSDGMVADVSIHRDKEHNPHAHIMLTMRPFNEDGSWGKKQRREYIFNEKGECVLDEKGNKKFNAVNTTSWNNKETLLEWRKSYAETVNQWYRNLNINEKISEKSYKDQGINRVPKHRLTRAEYVFEKKEKERAQLKNEKYIPTSHYAKENAKIEKENERRSRIEQLDKEIEKLTRRKEKVVSLSDYRKSFEQSHLEKLNAIRENANLSKSDWQAIKIVGNRLEGFVDLKSAQDNLNKLSNWDKKISHQERLIKAEQKVLITARNAFEKDKSKVLLYGFIPSEFKEKYNEKVIELKERKGKLEDSRNSFNRLYEKSIRVLEIQKEFTNEEFKFLYPNYKDNKIYNDKELLDIKAKYVELFRQEGTVRKSIPELEIHNISLSNRNDSLNKLSSEWKKLKSSLFVLEKTKEKYKDEYKNHYKDYDKNKVYDSFVKYTESQQQIIEKESLKEKVESQILSEITKLYPSMSKEKLSDISPSLQVELLDLHSEGNNKGNLQEDLRFIRENANSEFKRKDQNIFEENDNVKFSEAGKLVDSVAGMLEEQRTKDDDLEAKRQRNKNKRGSKDIDEHEL